MGALLAFLPANWKQIAQQVGIALAVAAVCLPLAYCKGESAASAKCDAKIRLATAKDLASTIAAGEKASTERVADALRIDKNEEKLVEAISQVPDTVPAPVAVALACQRLRNANYPESTLPASCGRGNVDHP